MDEQLRQEANAHKDELFAEFEQIRQLPDDQAKIDRIKGLYENLFHFKEMLKYYAKHQIYSQELRSELSNMIVAIRLKINALENQYEEDKSFFKPNINSGFMPVVGVTAPSTPPAATATATSASTQVVGPITPTITAIPSISITGGYYRKRKTRQRKTRQRKTHKNRR